MKKTPNPFDKFVGQRVRMARLMKGMSQEKLGDAIGLTFQQVQKYEKGTNRIGSSRMKQIAEAIDQPISYFFDEKQNGHAAEADLVTRFVTSPGGMKLAESFLAIKNNAGRHAVANVARALAQHG